MFENAFKAVDDILHKEAGCSTELDYVEQSSWVLFLKYLDDFETERADVASLAGASYTPIMREEYRWRSWAAPKGQNGKTDLNTALTGDDLLDFVNKDLWGYLAAFKQSAASPKTIEYKIGEIFGELKNKIYSGYNLREIIDRFDELRFGSAVDKHEMSSLYEDKIKNMGNAGRNGGEYYTPRPLIRAIVDVIDPKVGEKVYDPAVGSAGFLCEAYEYMRKEEGLSTEQLELLQKETFYGKEVKSLAYIIGIMNMILHGIEAPNILHVNTLSENVMNVQEKDRYDVIIANPPFGGKERKEVQQNFPIRSGETAYLFLQHFIRNLKAGGRAGIVIKNTFLSNGDAATLRKELLETCSLDIVLDCPKGTFIGTGVKTVVLFFTKGAPTKKIWYYQLDPGRNMGKTNPLNNADMEEFIRFAKTKPDSGQSWTLNTSTVDDGSSDLSVKNPNKVEESDNRTPSQILDEIEKLDHESAEILAQLRSLLSSDLDISSTTEPAVKALQRAPLGTVARIDYGTRVTRKKDGGSKFPVYGGGGATFSLDQSNRESCVIVSRFAMSEECVRYVEGKFFLNDSGLTVSALDETLLTQSYLDHFLLARSIDIFGLGKGTAQRNLDMGAFRSIQIPLPPLDEQKRVVALLGALQQELAALRGRLDKRRSLALSFRDRALAAAFAGDV